MVVRETVCERRAEELVPRPTLITMTEVSAAVGGGISTGCVSPASRDADVEVTSPDAGIKTGLSHQQASPAGCDPSVPAPPDSQQTSPQKQPVPRGYIPPALQNCLRCDACSCIYLDELDYYKHVRNYHSSTAQRRYRKSSQCRTCVFTKVDADQVTTLKSVQQNQRRAASPVNINVLQNNVKSRWSRMFGSRLRTQLTPLSTGLRAIDPRRVPLKSKVKMQAGLQPFVVRELDAKMQEMKQQRAIVTDAGDTSDTCSRDGGDIFSGDSDAAVRVKEEPRDREAECADLLQHVEVRIKTEPGEVET